MKRLIFLFFLSAVLSNLVNGQNCKFKTNEVDKFTNKMTRETKPAKIMASFYTAGDFSVKVVDTSYSFNLDYIISKYKKFEPYSINKGAKMIFLLENRETIELYSDDDIKGTKKTTYGIPPVYSCLLTNVKYSVTKKQIEKFSKYKVESIRFYRTEDNGKEDFIDTEIKDRRQDDIQNLVNCILSK